MALQILPVTLFCLSVAVVLWTLLSVLKHGFRMTTINQATGRRYTKASRVAMWWLLSCAALFLVASITDYYGLFGIAVLVFVIGGLAIGVYMGKTSSYSDEDMQSCLSLKMTSAAALFTGLSMLAAPLGAYIFRHPESDADLSDLLYMQVILLPFALGLIWESLRLWKKALVKSFQDAERSARQPPNANARGSDYMDRRWWISKVIRRKRSPHNSCTSPHLRFGKKGPHLVKAPKKR